jgi:hypothetical protein
VPHVPIKKYAVKIKIKEKGKKKKSTLHCLPSSMPSTTTERRWRGWIAIPFNPTTPFYRVFVFLYSFYFGA